MSNKRNVIATAIALGLASGLFTSSAAAQETEDDQTQESPTDDSATSIDKITVTGSRIKRTDTETVDPIQLFTAEDLAEQGYSTLYDALSNLSVNTGVFVGEEQTNNFNANAQALNLRGFGPGYTLVLLNGKRMPMLPKPAGNISGNVINLAMIPASAVQRIEVLTSGAAGEWRRSDDVGHFRAGDPATGSPVGPEFPRSSSDDIELLLTAAGEAADALAVTDPTRIARFLDTYADAIDAAKEALVATAHLETGLPASPRLADVELPRTTNQLRQAAKAVRVHAWTQPTIDSNTGLRAHFAPLGKPVLVFGPNNFPFAFNAVAGSDFASAIAARNPVIAKAHPSHPGTSKLLAELAHQAAIQCDLPAATVQFFYDVVPTLGLRLAGDRRVGAIGFTDSRSAGLALKAAADASGIPIYAEMSSINPVFIIPGALRDRADALAQEYFTSSTMGSGQFCTNPGIVMVPDGAAGDAFVADVCERFDAAPPMVLLSRGSAQHLSEAVTGLRHGGARVVGGGGESEGSGWQHAPVLLEVDAATFLDAAAALQQEAFGPISLVVRYHDTTEAIAVARSFDGNLTGSIHSASDGSDDGFFNDIAHALRTRVGRLIENKWPTGVPVSPAMQHGGPYPSTSHAGFTSVGMPGAIHRFAQWQSYDNVRDDRLPVELRDANPLGIQRLVDGAWTDRAL